MANPEIRLRKSVQRIFRGLVTGEGKNTIKRLIARISSKRLTLVIENVSPITPDEMPLTSGNRDGSGILEDEIGDWGRFYLGLMVVCY